MNFALPWALAYVLLLLLGDAHNPRATQHQHPGPHGTKQLLPHPRRVLSCSSNKILNQGDPTRVIHRRVHQVTQKPAARRRLR